MKDMAFKQTISQSVVLMSHYTTREGLGDRSQVDNKTVKKITIPSNLGICTLLVEHMASSLSIPPTSSPHKVEQDIKQICSNVCS